MRYASFANTDHMETYFGQPYKVLHFEGHKYWTMGAPLEDTILINRKKLETNNPRPPHSHSGRERCCRRGALSS